MIIFIHNLIIIIVDINPPCILILIKVGWAPLSRDGQGVELCRESTNFHPTPHWAWTTILMYHTTHTPIPHHTTPPNATLLPAATPISINSSPNLGLEPNPQTLTSGQSLNSSALNISICEKICFFDKAEWLFLNSVPPHPSPSSGEPAMAPNWPNYFPCTNYERSGPYIIGVGWSIFNPNYAPMPKYDFRPQKS